MEILKYPHPILRQVAKPVEVFEESLNELAAKMFQLMHSSGGIGLAAPQIGKSIRLIVMHVPDGKPAVIINPKVISKDGKQVFEEGCLSFPGTFTKLTSAETIEIEYQDLNGLVIKEIFTGVAAVCVQHEIDHLDGKLFLDRMHKKEQIKIKTRAMGGK